MTKGDKVYNALSERDMTICEIAKVLGMKTQEVMNSLSYATIKYFDVYEYDTMRKGRKVTLIGRLKNYKG